MDEGLPALWDAGLDVTIPPEFEGAGPRRMRARLKLSAVRDDDGRVDLSTLLKFLIWVAILAAAVWFVGNVVGGELGSTVTGWFRNW